MEPSRGMVVLFPVAEDVEEDDPTVGVVGESSLSTKAATGGPGKI